MTDRPAVAATDYLAAERTFLAWIRTGIALMGFGFVVARFGLFLQSLQIVQPDLLPRSPGLSPWFGTALIFLGIGVNLWSTWNHIRLIRQMQRGEARFTKPSTLGITLSVVLAVLGLALAFYLLTIRTPH